MIVVRVELHSAITRKVSEIARMHLWNTVTGSRQRGDYQAQTYRGRRERPELICQPPGPGSVLKQAELMNYPRRSLHVWNLVARMLNKMGYK